MISLAPLELIVLLAATALLAWRGGYHSATWPDRDVRGVQEHEHARDAMGRAAARRSR